MADAEAKEAKERVTEINSYISTAKNRQLGLFKLIEFLENCSSQAERLLLEKNCQFWLKTLFQVIENPLVSLHAKMAYYCFYLIVQSVRHLSPEINRIISTQYVDKSVQLLTSTTNVHSKNALMCLNELMSVYRASCSQFKQKIEQFVFARLDSDSDDVINWAAICYSKLPFLFKSSSANNNTSDLWHVYFKTMLRNANSVLNDLFSDLEESQIADTSEMSSEQIINDNKTTTPDHQKQLDMSSIFAKMPNKEIENLEFYYKKSSRRFRVATLCLSYLLRPLNECVPLKIRPREIVDFLKRIAMFNYKSLLEQARIDLSSRQLVDVMQDVYISVFRFFGDFFDLLTTNLLPYSTQINKYLVNLGQTLNQFILNNALSSYYNCLTKWLSALGTSSAFNLFSTSTIEKLIENIRPEQKAVVNIEDSRATSSKKSDQNNIMSSLRISDINSSQLQKRKDLIEAELKCLKCFIQLFNHKLSYDEFEYIQKSLVDIVCIVQYNSVSCQKPYDEDECRKALYETIEELCESKNVRLAPPIPIAINLFKNALNDSSLEIKHLAENVLRRLRAYTHPTRAVYIQEYTIIGQQYATDKPLSSTAAQQLDASQLVDALQASKFNLSIVKSQQQQPATNVVHTDFNHIKSQSSLFVEHKSSEPNESSMRLRLNCETSTTIKSVEPSAAAILGSSAAASNILTNSTNKRKMSESEDVSMSEEAAAAAEKSNMLKERAANQSSKQQRLIEKKSPSLGGESTAAGGAVLKLRSMGGGKKGAAMMVNRSDDDDDDVIDLEEDDEDEEEEGEEEAANEEDGEEEEEEFGEEEEDEDEEYDEEEEEEEEEEFDEDEEIDDDDEIDDEDEAVANEEGSEFTADDGQTDEISGIKPLDKTPEERKIVVEPVKPEHQIQDSESALCNTEVERIISHQNNNSNNNMPPPSICANANNESQSQSQSQSRSNESNQTLNHTKESTTTNTSPTVAVSHQQSAQQQQQPQDQDKQQSSSRSASAASKEEKTPTTTVTASEKKRRAKKGTTATREESSNLEEDNDNNDEEDEEEEEDSSEEEEDEEEMDDGEEEDEEEEEVVATAEEKETAAVADTCDEKEAPPLNSEKPESMVIVEKKDEPMAVDNFNATTNNIVEQTDPKELEFKNMCSSLNLNAIAKDDHQTASTSSNIEISNN